MTYQHLTQEERYQIHALDRQNVSAPSIAAELGRHRSTITRELKRNAGDKGYKPAQAHKTAVARQTQRSNSLAFSEPQWAHVRAYLLLGLSPQQVQGRLSLEGVPAPSHECIYQYIYRNKRHGGQLCAGLRCQKTRRKRYGSGRERRGVLKDRVGIEHRPQIVHDKTRMGDWEGDTVIGKGHQGALVTLVERTSRYLLSAPVPSKHSAGVTEAIIALLRPHKSQCLTLTFDNGKELAEHGWIAQSLGADVYFARPYHSWERGLNENTNGLLRQYFPKKTNLRGVTQAQVQDAVYKLNHRPRKCLGYRTPHEVFFGLQTQPFKLPSDALCC